MTDQKSSPFDFSDTSDLPEDIAKHLTTADRSAAAREWAEVVAAGREAGYKELNINQIMAAATRMGLEVPTAQTVRGYLNRAVELGYLTKPSRQSYAAPAKGTRARTEAAGLGEGDAVTSADVGAAVEPVEGTEAPDADPLASIGLG